MLRIAVAKSSPHSACLVLKSGNTKWRRFDFEQTPTPSLLAAYAEWTSTLTTSNRDGTGIRISRNRSILSYWIGIYRWTKLSCRWLSALKHFTASSWGIWSWKRTEIYIHMKAGRLKRVAVLTQSVATNWLELWDKVCGALASWEPTSTNAWQVSVHQIFTIARWQTKETRVCACVSGTIRFFSYYFWVFCIWASPLESFHYRSSECWKVSVLKCCVLRQNTCILLFYLDRLNIKCISSRSSHSKNG